MIKAELIYTDFLPRDSERLDFIHLEFYGNHIVVERLEQLKHAIEYSNYEQYDELKNKTKEELKPISEERSDTFRSLQQLKKEKFWFLAKEKRQKAKSMSSTIKNLDSKINRLNSYVGIYSDLRFFSTPTLILRFHGMLDELGFRTVSSKFDPHNYVDTNILEADFGKDEILFERINRYCKKHNITLPKQNEIPKFGNISEDEKTL